MKNSCKDQIENNEQYVTSWRLQWTIPLFVIRNSCENIIEFEQYLKLGLHNVFFNKNTDGESSGQGSGFVKDAGQNGNGKNSYSHRW